jgi:hypothetical protein
MYLNESQFIDFLKDREITWMGIDFSLAQFTQKGFDLPKDSSIQLLNDWNTLIISDQKKYDIRLSFRKPVMHYNLAFISKKNKQIRASQILKEHIDTGSLLTDEKIKELLKKIAFPGSSRYALMMIVQSFDHASKSASVWVVIANTQSKEVVLSETFIKNPGGIGIRNYWARIFYNILLDIHHHSFIRWSNLVKKDEI